MSSKPVKIALAGNPNSGKTTLFNSLTGLNQKIGNFPGVTVDKKTGKCILPNGREAILTDLPGTYSLYPKSIDESVTHKVLCNPADSDFPDIIVVVADGSNLKRNLLLATQIIDLKIPCILVLNMMDLVLKQKKQINIECLSQKLGIKVISMNARESKGILDLKTAVQEPLEKPAFSIYDIQLSSPDFSSDINALFKNSTNSAYSNYQLACNFKLSEEKEHESDIKTIAEIIHKHSFNEKQHQNDETLIRYKFISDLLFNCSSSEHLVEQNNFTSKADKILTHKIGGFLIFVGIMFLIFQTIFNLSVYPMQFIEWSFIQLSISVSSLMPPGILNSLIVDGVIAGLSGIMIFIPQIAFLFAFIGIMEDTGYMARVSFIMDRLMRKFGLNGKSVIPLLSGTACAIPAIMATRTIGNWKERMITIMVVPLISCSARIPVYTLLISLVIPSSKLLGIFNLQGIALLILYLIGFAGAIAAAFVFKLILKSKERSIFIMEMPVYRAPRWSSIGLTIFEKTKTFVFEAGKVIIAISIILWGLSSYGPSDDFAKIEQKYKKNPNATEVEEKMASDKLEASYAGRFGKAIEPAIKPLGFDWKIGIALITSFAAREVFVGTMATIYSVGDPDNTSSIRKKMSADTNTITGKKTYSRATGISLMVFFAFALQCMSTLAVTLRETKHWKWPLYQFLFMGAMAYVASFIVFNLFK
ncbi:MAG: ferrous iron transport protein B [Bacteroidetes bacterium]|nr:ferrous iron transport protein B [Bacteroidota bacterium]